jgi:hypothetical protein
MSELNGGTGENENRLRLDRMNVVIQSMITLTLDQGKMYDRQHAQTMTEIKAQRHEFTLQHERTMAEMAEIRAHDTAFVKTLREQHTVFTEEVRDLITLQKERRIDIMALFAANKQLREAWSEYLKRQEPDRPV